MEVVVTTGAVSRAKLQSNCHHQQTNTHLFTGRTPFLSPNQQRQINEWKTKPVKQKSKVVTAVVLSAVVALVTCGSVAEWSGSQTCDQKVAGSNPGRRAAECNPGKVVYTHVPLSISSIIWYRPIGGLV